MKFPSKSEIREQKKLAGKIDNNHPLFETVQDAYNIFRQGPTEHAVCDCCMSSKVRADFFKHGQRNLPLEYINDWFFAAADIPMKQAQWRFVLPRILEVLASGNEPSSTGYEVSLSRFPTGDANCWNKEEWQILERFRYLFLEQISEPDSEFLDDYICMFANAGWPCRDLFKQVFSWSNEVLTLRLWNDWCSWGKLSAVWITTFWDSTSEPREYYLSNHLYERMTDYALKAETPKDLADKASDIADVIQYKLVL